MSNYLDLISKHTKYYKFKKESSYRITAIKRKDTRPKS